MTIALIATESIPLASVASRLTGEGFDVRAIAFDSLRSIQTLGPEIKKAVLIVSKHGAGEQTNAVSRLLIQNMKLILCAPQPENDGYELLKAMGATDIITPRGWQPEHISERILAQLFLDLGDAFTRSVSGNLIGASRIMRDLYQEIIINAPYEDPVLILGETGTGKELVAREIHKLSKLPGELLAINCGALNPNLAGSELFGHVKGAYTNASEARKGKLVEAGQGTVFLDEIGELDLQVQTMLLRVLEEKKVTPLGSNKAIPAPARIVLATNRDLEQECEKGKFKHDLFERIRGSILELRPLRERREDIPLLVLHFLSEFNRKNEQAVRLPVGALDCLFNYEWGGNVRELKHAVESAAKHADTSGFISSLYLLKATKQKQARKSLAYQVTFDPAVDTLKDFIKRANAAYIQAVLKLCDGDKKKAARRTDLSLSQFYEKLKSIDPAD